MTKINGREIKVTSAILVKKDLSIRNIKGFYQQIKRKLNLSKMMRIFPDQGSMKLLKLRVYSNLKKAKKYKISAFLNKDFQLKFHNFNYLKR